MPIRIGIVEDEKMVQESLEMAFNAYPGFISVLKTSSVEQALSATPNDKPDIILLDIGLPGLSGLEGIQPLKSKYEGCEIIILTTYEEPDKIFSALCNGAVAYLTKRTSIKDILDVAQTVYNGGSYMSPSIARKIVEYFGPKPVSEADEHLSARQLQIIQGIVDGLSYKMIADRLGISMDTVRDHIKKIYRKLEVNSKTELIRISMDRRLLGKPGFNP